MTKEEYLRILDVLSDYNIVSTAGIKEIAFQNTGKIDLYHLNKGKASNFALNDIGYDASFAVSAYAGSHLASLLSARQLTVRGV